VPGPFAPQHPAQGYPAQGYPAQGCWHKVTQGVLEDALHLKTKTRKCIVKAKAKQNLGIFLLEISKRTFAFSLPRCGETIASMHANMHANFCFMGHVLLFHVYSSC